MNLPSLVFGLSLFISGAHAQDPTPTTETVAETATSTGTTTATTTEANSSTNTVPATDTATATIPETTTATDAVPSTTETTTQTGTQTGTETTTATTAGTVPPTKEDSAPAVSINKEPAKAPAKEAHGDGHGEGHVAGQFTIDAMWAASSTPVRVVLLTLLFMMLACIYVGFERFLALNASQKRSEFLRNTIEEKFRSSDFVKSSLMGQVEILASSTQTQEESYLKSIMSAGIQEFSARQDSYGIEAVERALEKSLPISH